MKDFVYNHSWESHSKYLLYLNITEYRFVYFFMKKKKIGILDVFVDYFRQMH